MPSIPIADIRIGERHRTALGDLSGLAESIRSEGLLQPIGTTPNHVLVFGERRLRACRDILGWSEIPIRIVNVSSIAAGEWAENELRKNFTPSERVAILRTIDRKPEGRPTANSQNFASIDDAAKRSGFGNRETARQAAVVVDRGAPELIQAMDKRKVGIATAAKVAQLDVDDQQEVIDSVEDGDARSFREAFHQITATEEEYHPRSTRQSRDDEPEIIPPPKDMITLSTLQTMWNQAGPHVRRQFIAWLKKKQVS